jgi:hypothetical protein
VTDIEALARVLAESRRGTTAKVNDIDRVQAQDALAWMRKAFNLDGDPEVTP